MVLLERPEQREFAAMHGDRNDAVGDDIHPAHFELGAGRVVAGLHVSAQRSRNVGG